MNHRTRNPTSSRLPAKRRRGAGFTLVEIMIVVVIVGVLAALALPSFQLVRENSRNAAVMNDMRVFSDAFVMHNLETGTWPEDRLPGEFPPEMDGWLSEGRFTGATPLGGLYDWDPESSGSKPSDARIVITVRDYTVPESQIIRLLDRYDDGNAATGRIRSTGSNLFYIVEMAP